jgi:hypothetical protein
MDDKTRAAQWAQFRDNWEDAVCAPTVNGKDNTLTGVEKLVLLRYVRYRSRDTGMAYPSAARVAKDAGVSRRTALRALQRAEQLGFLITVKAGGTSTGKNMSSERAFVIPTGSDTGGHGVVTETTNPSFGDRGVVTQEAMGSDTGGHGVVTQEATQPLNEPLNEPLKDSSPAEAGGARRAEADRSTEKPTSYDRFVEMVKDNPLLNERLAAYSREHGLDPQEAYDEFYENCGEDMSRSWIKKFRGFVKDWSESHAA